MKKLLTILLSAIMAVACCFGLTACGDDDDTGVDVKIGLICLHDNNSTYDKNFIDAFTAACSATGAKSIIKTNIPESNACYETAADLVDQGCDLIFANSFGHEPYMIQAAEEFTDVQFFHATGTKAHTQNLNNYHNAFASIYEGRYLAGVAAGLKLQAMVAAEQISADKYESGNIKLGYVGAFPYAEVVSGYTSWFLGVRSVVSNVVMKVQYTSSWYDENGEKTAAENLINNEKVALLSQHADSWGAPTACETAGIPNVSYNGSTASRCPNTFIISSRINWQPYYEHIINSFKNGNAVAADWSQGLGSNWGDGAVALTEVGAAAAEGTEAYLNNVISQLKAGTLKVFDTDKFTVDGQKVTTYLADVDDMGDYVGETEVIKTEGGITYFAESEFRSAPYFDLRIDGITELN
ncbi:MAG: BMP family ABC transporter substrate-binding protein [Clostridia bacterium]|nr:BMP family ABC transporter substrate-binding protein [Clostridia bacterium]